MNRIVAFLGFVVSFEMMLATDALAVSVQSPSLRVEFASSDEGFGVRSIVNLLSGEIGFVGRSEGLSTRWRVLEYEGCVNDFQSVSNTLNQADLWELELRDKSALGDVSKAVFVDNRSACRQRRCLAADKITVFSFDGVVLPEGEVDVQVSVRIEEDGSTKWKMSSNVKSGRYVQVNTHFPTLRAVVRPKEADLLRPRHDLGAELLREADFLEYDGTYSCLAYVPMMTAFMRDGVGLYIGVHDDKANAKTLVISHLFDVSFSSPHPTGDFEVTIAGYRGDWWQAARIYRNWALTAPWCRKGRILDRSDYPRRLCEIPLWFNFHGDAVAASNALTRAKTLFPGVTTGLHWHRWQAVPWEIGHYPEYFPAGAGVQECIRYCRSIGQEPLLYTLPRLYSRTLLSFHFAEPYALKDENGNYYVEYYGRREDNPPPLVPMCPASRMWQDCTVDYAGRVLEMGARSIFLDQFASCPAKSCWSVDHGHDAGGGDWFYRAQHEICRRIHDVYSPVGAFTTAEGSADQFVDVVDGLLTVTERQLSDVPFWHAVYNGYTTYFGTPENHDDDDDTFWAMQTREMLWGQSLGWYHTLLMDRTSKVEMVNKLIAFRQRNLDCLAYGDLLGEIEFCSPISSMPIVLLGRKSFPDWANPKACLSPSREGTMPSLIGYVYRSGVSGKTCAMVANLTTSPQNVDARIADRVIRLRLVARELKRIDGL